MKLVYIFVNIDDNYCYIGLSTKIVSRLRTHKYNVKKHVNNYKNGCPKFYNYVLKHGWSKFKVGVLEYIDVSNTTYKEEIKNILLNREKYYFNNINPSLNIRK